MNGPQRLMLQCSEEDLTEEFFCQNCGAPHEPVCSYCGTPSKLFLIDYGYFGVHVVRPEMHAKLVDTNVSTR